MIVLDASALLALLFRETGHELVASHLDESCISTVNLCEVIGRFTRDGHNAQFVLQKIAATAIEIVPFSLDQAMAAATFLPQTRSLGLSLADRACLALAFSRNTAVLTADAIWEETAVGVDVVLLR